MTTFRNVKVKMKGGKTRIQRAMVLASGKFKFVKNLSRSRASKPETAHKTRRNSTMGKKKGHRSNGKLTLPIAPIVGLGIGIAAPNRLSGNQSPLQYALAGNWDLALTHASINFLGYNPKDSAFHLGEAQGLKGLLIGGGIHYLIGNRLGINRMLGRAKVPLLRL